MSKPKVFISSTFYDLRQVRADIDRFIKDLGYDPVLNELGNIPYGKEEKLEEYCYKEIGGVDILVAIIGGRFGSESNHEGYSISQIEIKTALEQNKQVYLFIDKNVLSEYQTYLFNKDNQSIKYRFVDNIRIYEFIELVEALPNNNTIQPFETSNEIILYLKEQWAGLFQRFLQDQVRIKEINLIKGIENTSRTLNQLVNYLTEERKDKDQAIQDILLSNHPAIEQVQKLFSLTYRIFFANKDELVAFLKARGFSDTTDFLPFGNDPFYEFQTIRGKTQFIFRVDSSLFNEDGKLKVYTKSDWKEELITLTNEPIKEENDLPF